MRFILWLSSLMLACGSSDSDADGEGSCPNVAGTWNVTEHCDSSLIGMDAVVSQNGCALTFAPPFDAFEGSVKADRSITLSGPQTCSGSVSSDSISLSCTPGMCVVKLSR